MLTLSFQMAILGQFGRLVHVPSNERNMTSLFKKYAKWFVELNDIWNQATAFRCQTNQEAFVKSVRNLGYVLYKMGLVEDIPGLSTAYVRENYLYSARALEAFA